MITHAVPIAALLAPLPHVELHLLPGRVRPTTEAAVGHATVEAIGRLRADLVFVGTNGISPSHSLSTPDPEEAAVKRALIRSAQRVVALTDATKVGQERTVRFADLEDVDVLVTDCLRREPHPTHAHLAMALDLAKRCRAGRAVLTHLDKSMDYATLSGEVPANVSVGFDGMELVL